MSSVRRSGTAARRAGPPPTPVDTIMEGVPRRSGTTRRGPGADEITASTPVRRSGTKRFPGTDEGAPGGNTSSAVPPRRGTTKRTKRGYEGLLQGMKELYPADPSPGYDYKTRTDMDIVFVPGLAAHPEESWMWRKGGFNWASDKEGLARDFPRARILLYMYESSWLGDTNVKQYISNLAETLLRSLQGNRPDPRKGRSRPIIFIGHSMGGLVIAKAICYAADSRQESFPYLFENIAGCVFFGTPFGGAPAAAYAAMVAYVVEKVADKAKSSKLLDLMKPDDDGLYDLRNDFVRCVGKLSQRIKLYAFFEQHPTDYAAIAAGKGVLGGLLRLITPGSLLKEVVSRDSATLSGVIDSMGLAANHSDLVKFESFKDLGYQCVREPLKRIIHGAHLVVKNRLNSTRDIDREMVKGLMDILDGAQVAKKRKMISQSVASSSWIPKEKDYVSWLANLNDTPGEDSESEVKGGDCLWIRGSEGRGKTSATLAALDDIDEMIRNQEKKTSSPAPILLAYFFCDPSSDYCTAEDLLKSLVRQLISRQEMLATHAKQFIKKKGKDDSKTQTSMTVENLWQTLQVMLGDEEIGARVYFVIHNLHVLPDLVDSTKKLMAFLQSELQCIKDEDYRSVPVRWLFTSRNSRVIRESLATPGTRLIDLENEKYSNQVQLALRRHAQTKIRELAARKQYTKALTYFSSSLIGKKAQNTQWIDIACVRLEEFRASNDLQVRRMLEAMPEDLNKLLDHAWTQIFTPNADHADKIREILRVMVLTYEDPTLEELEMLAGFEFNESEAEDEGVELQVLVDKCKPLLEVKRSGKIGFMNTVVKKHLLEDAEDLLGLSDEKIQWQHGVIAHRAFSHIMESCRSQPENDVAASEAEEVAEEESEEDWQGGQYAEEDETSDSEDEFSFSGDDPNNAMEEAADQNHQPAVDALPYAVKHWLHHASKATLEIAEEISHEDAFWERDSPIRQQWLLEYTELTKQFLDDFQHFDHSSLTAVHVAASIGFRELVAALIRNGHESDIRERDATRSTPLHYAAWFGRPHIVEVLLDNDALVDDGADITKMTPLHMAACQGNVEVMERLLKSKADPNAMCDELGPVINAAIMSGNRKAVELLVDAKADLSIDSDEFESPLALASLFPDKSMFDYLVKSCSDKLPDKEYEKALIKAAEEGRVDILEQLISGPIQYSRECYEQALREAERESNWDIIRILLKQQPGLDCVNLFRKAATGTGQVQDQILADIWEYTNGSIPSGVLNGCLYRATDLEKESTVELLLSFKADPNTRGHEYGNCLTASAFDGTINITKMLIKAGADVNSPHGWALQAAAAGGHYQVVDELLRQGADVNNVVTNNNRMRSGTALQAACEAGKRDVVELLLQHNANPDLGPGPGSSTCPLIVASRKGEQDIFESLVNAKAGVDVFGGPEKTTPLINAVGCLPRQSLELLLDAGADINLADKQIGDTALIVASRKGDADLVAFLLDNGADILHSNKRGENALQAAALGSRTECLVVLINHMSKIMRALKKAIGEGNTAVENVIKAAAGQNSGTISGPIPDEPVAATVPPPQEAAPEVNGQAPETAVVKDQPDDSFKILASDSDMPEYMVGALPDEMGIPMALPSLGLPQGFHIASPPPGSPPPIPPIQTQELHIFATAVAPYHSQQETRAWTPDSAPLTGTTVTSSTPGGSDSSRATSPAIIRRKPASGKRNSGMFQTTPLSGRGGPGQKPTSRPSFDVLPSPRSHTFPTSGHSVELNSKESSSSLGQLHQQEDIRPLSQSPQGMQNPFVPPPPPLQSPPSEQQPSNQTYNSSMIQSQQQSNRASLHQPYSPPPHSAEIQPQPYSPPPPTSVNQLAQQPQQQQQQQHGYYGSFQQANVDNNGNRLSKQISSGRVATQATSPPISYDGEGWGDSPVVERPTEHLRHAMTDIVDPKRGSSGLGWMTTGGRNGSI